jgi:cytochrome c-type biogenesis protein CcmF
MPNLGTFLLLSAFVVCSYAGVVSVVGARRRSRALIESGIGAFYLICALMTAASAVMINAFVTDDFSIKYVSHYSDSVQPMFYKFTSYWGGLDGSIMFWVFLLSIFGSVAVFVNRERHRELIPYVVATISVVEGFFLYLMVVHNNPFTTYLTPPPADGTGLNPVLQNYWMVIHPPSLYTGFVGMTIPYAFGMAALITGHLDDAWLRAVRRWTMFAWLFLSFGLTLGMIWAYEELGWGGFWGWDPVENAGLLPWFTATAFLHSVMVQERRSMLRVWNVTLVIVTFFLTIFGTFMTRSGVVQSVHAFGEDPELAKLFTIFMIAIVTISFGFVIYRLPLLRSRNELDSYLSREAAFMVNNWILLFCAFFVLFATMFPTLSEAITGERLTVASPFFNQWMTPIGLTLLMLTGIGPLLGWRKSTLGSLRNQFMWPALSGAVTLGAVFALGFRQWSAIACFALCGFVLGTVVQEFWHGAIVRRRSTGTDIFTALIGLVGRNKRRYGGYIVHVGIVLFFIGVAGQSYKQSKEILLKPGESTTIDRYTVSYESLRVSDDGQKQMVTGTVTTSDRGKAGPKLYPAKWFFHKHEQEPPTTEVAMWRRPGEDLYVVLAAFEAGSQAASLQITINPLVNWVWFGFGVLAFGTIIALLPERTFSFAMAKAAEDAARAGATVGVVLLTLALSSTNLFAQHMESSNIAPVLPRNDIERHLGQRLVCLCGGCGKEPIGVCTCDYAKDIRRQIASLVDQGKSEDEILQHFIAQYGSEELLGAPIDKGFNRVAWLFPYVAGATGVAALGFVAVRWTRRHVAAPPEASAPADAELNERLDDELRGLD